MGIKGSPDLLAAREVAQQLGTLHHEFHFTVEEGIDAVYDLIYHIESYEQVTRCCLLLTIWQGHSSNLSAFRRSQVCRVDSPSQLGMLAPFMLDCWLQLSPYLLWHRLHGCRPFSLSDTQPCPCLSYRAHMYRQAHILSDSAKQFQCCRHVQQVLLFSGTL